MYNGNVGSVFVINKDDDSSELIVVNATKNVEEGDEIFVRMKLSSSPVHEVTVIWHAEVVTGQVQHLNLKLTWGRMGLIKFAKCVAV